ncbi:arylamine N-acetyltransferase 4 [Xylariales sp. PMI_506]|nr:arylamine N-acetyltransferase 4 [Xylariales sp. PMI_506]
MLKPKLTPDQVSEFLEYIGLPTHLRTAPPSLTLLRALHIHTIAALPYENLSIHYNPSHTVVLDPLHVFRKVVTDARGRGGYCMEIAIFFNHVLRSLGFSAYTAGAKTRPRFAGVPQGDFPGWVHIVNIVDLSATSDAAGAGADGRWSVDVAFGGDGPTEPLPLVPGRVHQNLGTQQVRLVRDWLPPQLHRTEATKYWVYEYRNAIDLPWNAFYAFTELEFTPMDWEVVNWYTHVNTNSFQTHRVLVVKFLRRAKDGIEDEQEIYGKRMLIDGIIKENLGGKTQTVAECKSEVERLTALDQFFGIRLTEKETISIKGCSTDLDQVL